MNMLSEWYRRTFSDPQMVMLVLALVAAVIAISLFGNMLAPAIAAVVIAFLLDGPIEWLTRKGAPRFIAFIMVYLAFITLSVFAMLTIVPLLISQVSEFVGEAPAMVTSTQKALLLLQQRFPDLISQTQVESWLAGLGNEIANLGPRLLQYSLTGLTGAVGFVVYAVLVPVMVFFFLKDKRQIIGWIASFLPQDKPVLEQVWRETLDRAGDYARGKVYEIVIVAAATAVTFHVLGLRYATLLAVATGISVIIPYFGAAAVTLPVTLVAYFQWGLGPDMWVAIIAYLILQALDGNLLVPLLFSETVKLHPNAIIIGILIFGGIWGFWGVFFAIPLATVANAIIRAWRERSSGNTLQANA